MTETDATGARATGTDATGACATGADPTGADPTGADPPAVLGVDPGTGERPVEPVDGRRWQAAHGPGREGVTGRVERLDRLAQRVDRQHLRRGERVGADEQVELVDDRIREPDGAGPELVGLVAQRVLLTDPRARRQRQRRHLGRRQRLRRRRDRQLVVERVQDQRRDREDLVVQRVGERDRGTLEDSVLRQQPAGLQGRLHEHLPRPEAHGGDTHRADPQHVPASDAGASGFQVFPNLGHDGQPPVARVPAPTVGVRWPGLSRVRAAAIDGEVKEDALRPAAAVPGGRGNGVVGRTRRWRRRLSVPSLRIRAAEAGPRREGSAEPSHRRTLPLRLFGQREYEPRVLLYPTPQFGKEAPQNWGEDQSCVSYKLTQKRRSGVGEPATVSQRGEGD